MQKQKFQEEYPKMAEQIKPACASKTAIEEQTRLSVGSGNDESAAIRHLESMKCAHEHSCPWHPETKRDAARNRKLENMTDASSDP